MFTRSNEAGYRGTVPGVKYKTLTYGDKTLLAEFKMEKGYLLPRHSHPHEQIGYLVSGSIDMTIGDKTFAVKPGDSWCVKGGVEHQVMIHEDSIAIEVFSPVRTEYLPDAR